MANANPPKKNQAFAFAISLESMNAPGEFQLNPTLAAGDFKLDKDGAGNGTFATLPTSGAGLARVYITLTATEMDADIVWLQGIDQTTPKEWADWSLCILTTA